jgi:hypothetical protein
MYNLYKYERKLRDESRGRYYQELEVKSQMKHRGMIEDMIGFS